MAETVEMKMAKCSDKDIAEMYRFARQLEMVENYSFRDYEPDELSEDPEILLIEDTVNGGVNLHRWIEAWVPKLSSEIWRLLMGYQTLVHNVCDPEKDYMDWKPELNALLNPEDD